MKTSILSVCLLALATSVAAAQEFKAGSIEIDNPWSRATPKGAKVAAGYLVIKNNGTDPDRLVGGTSPVAGKVEVHEMSMDKGVMKMRPVSGGLEIKPGETVELKPSSFHLMIMDLKQQIENGKPFKASLNFEKAGPVEIQFNVVAPGATPSTASEKPAGDMPAGMHDMNNMHQH